MGLRQQKSKSKTKKVPSAPPQSKTSFTTSSSGSLLRPILKKLRAEEKKQDEPKNSV